MKGISSKEMEMISWLELEGKRFFTRADIRQFFRDDNEMNVYLHTLKKKQRILKINKSKYYLIPIQAYKNHWSEHPFIIIDEMFNGKGYYIGGKSAAHYWGHIEQIPMQIDVYCTNRQGMTEIFSSRIRFKRQKELKPCFIKRTLRDHTFQIATKKESRQWI